MSMSVPASVGESGLTAGQGAIFSINPKKNGRKEIGECIITDGDCSMMTTVLYMDAKIRAQHFLRAILACFETGEKGSASSYLRRKS